MLLIEAGSAGIIRRAISHYAHRLARADRVFVDICPNGQRRCCFAVDRYPTGVAP